MIRNLLLVSFMILGLSLQTEAQLQDGSIAPDFTAVDIDGNSHNLYDLLAAGKTVVMDVSATWCPPCWSYHNGGALKDFMNDFGPDGSNDAMVLFIEGDASTTLADLQGTGGNTMGNWIDGTNYPIIDNGGISSMYNVGAFPTIYMICPDRKVTSVGQITSSQLASRMGTCDFPAEAPIAAFTHDNFIGCEELVVNFNEESWPRPETYLWDFGDGTTSTERLPQHTYDAPGEYDVTLTVSNQFGMEELTKQDAIVVGEGYPQTNQQTGKLTNAGGGRMFEGGHQGLFIDAHVDFILSSALVYSDKEAWRTFVVTNVDEVVVARREVFIPEGEHRIELEMGIPQGTDLRLGMWSDAFLYRNNAGVNYPYVLDDIVTITTSTVDPASDNPLNYYYYLYDWKVRDAECSESPSNVEDLDKESMQLFPNPVSDLLTITSSDKKLYEAVLTDYTGKVIRVANNYVPGRLTMEVGNLQPGVYLVTVGDKTRKFHKL